MGMLIWTNPYLMVQVLGVLVLIVLPSLWFGTARAQAVTRQPGPDCRLQLRSLPRC
jgi:hypothetical protein